MKRWVQIFLFVTTILFSVLTVGAILLALSWHKNADYERRIYSRNHVFDAKALSKIHREQEVDECFLKGLCARVGPSYKKLDQTIPHNVKTVRAKYTASRLKKESRNYTKPVLFLKHPGVQVENRRGKEWHPDEQVSVRKKGGQGCGVTGYEYRYMRYGDYLEKRDEEGWRLFNAAAALRTTMKAKELKKNGLIVDVFESLDQHLTGIHNEANSTLNVQLEGEKQWVLVDPRHSDLLVPLPLGGRNNISGLYSTSGQILEQTNVIPTFRIVLRPGDMLFVPSWWWHECVSLGESYAYSIRCAHGKTWHHPGFAPSFLMKFMGLLLPPLHGLIYKYFKPGVGASIARVEKKYGKKREWIFNSIKACSK